MKCDCCQPEHGHCACAEQKENYDFHSEAAQIDAVTFLKQKNRMCDLGCKKCPIDREIGDDTIDCVRWIEKYPEKTIKLVEQWAIAHPELITWNQWLHSIYESNSHQSLCFLEWLNTPIPTGLMEKYNIYDS